MKSVFSVVLSTDEVLAIADRLTCDVVRKDPSSAWPVTCDTAEVVEYCAAKLALGNRLLLYRDTMGIWDEIVHHEGKYVEFRLLNAEQLDVAVNRALYEVTWRSRSSGDNSAVLTKKSRVD